MFRSKKKKIDEDVEARLCAQVSQIEKALAKRCDEIEKGLIDRLARWRDDANERQAEDIAKNSRHRDHSYKHMTVIEDYLDLQRKIIGAQTEVLVEIRDAMKVLALKKLRLQRVLNEQN